MSRSLCFPALRGVPGSLGRQRGMRCLGRRRRFSDGNHGRCHRSRGGRDHRLGQYSPFRAKRPPLDQIVPRRRSFALVERRENGQEARPQTSRSRRSCARLGAVMLATRKSGVSRTTRRAFHRSARRSAQSSPPRTYPSPRRESTSAPAEPSRCRWLLGSTAGASGRMSAGKPSALASVSVCSAAERKRCAGSRLHARKNH